MESVNTESYSPCPPPPPPVDCVISANTGDKEDGSALEDGIRSFQRDALKPTTTVVYGLPVVAGAANITAAPDEEEVKEYYDNKEEVVRKAKEFANLLRSSKHFVVYTGAGISTAARIPDYRGPQGVWTLQAKGMAAMMPITLEQALPTYSHMALVSLMRSGILKYVVSTNVDGLHRRSGIPEESIAELHGNIYREVCSNKDCGKEFLRPFNVTKTCVQRKTGRLCNSCRSRLVDSIINFGENLPEKALSEATRQSSMADITLVLGSSMRVAPACELPSKSYKKGGTFCICNLQKTPFDKHTDKGGLRIFAKCDDFMRAVMEELGMEVEEFKGEEDDEIARKMEEMIFDESPFSGRIAASMAEDPIPMSVLNEILAGHFNLRPINRHN